MCKEYISTYVPKYSGFYTSFRQIKASNGGPTQQCVEVAVLALPSSVHLRLALTYRYRPAELNVMKM